MQVTRHVISLLLHVCTHLVEGGGRDEVALAVNLPSDGCIFRANLVTAGRASSRAGVCGNIFPHFAINNGATHEVGVVVALIVDDCEDLRLNANRIDEILCVGTHSVCHGLVPTTENTIVEWGLKLMRSVARANGRVWPMNFVGLTHMHVNAMLPIVRRCELGIVCIVMLTRITVPHLTSK